MDLNTIDSILDKANPAARKHWDQIGRDSQMYTVALFALSASPQGDILTLAGTGTLVADGTAHYILTAAHVWHEVLKQADKLGISLRENVDHRCLMDIATIVPSGPAKAHSWNEWGPDLIFLRIPEVRVGEIEAFRVFYGLGTGKQVPLKGEHIQTYLLVGTPHVLGTFEQNHAGVHIMGFWVGLPTYHTHEGLDYFDARASFPPPSNAKSFGGVSGGGLWKVQIYGEASSDKIASRATLEGVAFYEVNVADGTGTIRCHGPESIRLALLNLKTA